MEIWTDDLKKGKIMNWFKLAARARAVDTYWDPTKECIKNMSNKMLLVAMDNEDNLYWEAEKLAEQLAAQPTKQQTQNPSPPKCKHIQIEEESIDDMVLTIKSGLSTKKTRKSALKNKTTAGQKELDDKQDSAMTASQATSILQLTKQVNEIKQMNKMFISCFDKLVEQMAALLAVNTNQPHSQCPAGGHSCKSSQAK